MTGQQVHKKHRLWQMVRIILRKLFIVKEIIYSKNAEYILFFWNRLTISQTFLTHKPKKSKKIRIINKFAQLITY